MHGNVWSTKTLDMSVSGSKRKCFMANMKEKIHGQDTKSQHHVSCLVSHVWCDVGRPRLVESRYRQLTCLTHNHHPLPDMKKKNYGPEGIHSRGWLTRSYRVATSYPSRQHRFG
ncbi:hypothetical protein KDRO_A04490 [Kluyveromyces lactis]|nr:hypothetical protein KDRO_A04490 [Kluyveromyces lactis]